MGVGRSCVLECLMSTPLCLLLLWSPPLQSWPCCCRGVLTPGVWPFPSLLLHLVVSSVPVTCVLKPIFFVVLLDTLLPLIPVQVFVFEYVFLLVLVWLAVLSKASLRAFLSLLRLMKIPVPCLHWWEWGISWRIFLSLLIFLGFFYVQMNFYFSQHFRAEWYVSSNFFTDSTWKTQALIKLLFY